MSDHATKSINLSTAVNPRNKYLRDERCAGDLDRLDGRTNHHFGPDISNSGANCKFPFRRQGVVLVLQALCIGSCGCRTYGDGAAEKQKDPALEGWCEHHIIAYGQRWRVHVRVATARMKRICLK